MSGAVGSTKRFLRQYYRDVRQLLAQERQLRRHGMAYYNFWELPPVPATWFYRFLQRPALRPLHGRQRVGFFSVFGRRRLVDWARCDRRIFFTGENLARFPAYHDHLLDRVDLALGFDHLDHPRYLRFPLWLLECFDPLATHADLVRQLAATAGGAAGEEAPRRHFAMLIARHDRSGLRAAVGDVVGEFGEVCYPAAFRFNDRAPLAPGWEAKLKYLRTARYNICPENAARPGYVTEKLFHATMAGCVPIYWGGDRRPEPDVLRAEAMLFYDPQRPDDLRQQLRQLVADERCFEGFRRQPRFQATAADRIYGYYTTLEQQLLKLLS